MYDNITPEQWVIGLVVSLVVFAGLVWLLWHYFPSTEGARDMSSDDASAAPAAGMEPVYIPVSQYGMERPDMDVSPADAPDIDAQNTGMPRVSRDISSDELIVLLAVMRGPDRKPRFSANAIHTLVGGDRNTVLAKVKEIRSGPDVPVFPPLSEEQQQARRALQLDQVKR